LINTIDNAIHEVKSLRKTKTIDSFYHAIKIFKTVCSGISGEQDGMIIAKVQELQKEIYKHEPEDLTHFRKAAFVNSFMHLPGTTFDTVSGVYNNTY